MSIEVMTLLTTEDHRTDLLNRLKRAEGQLRGVQRMISDGEPCLAIANQMAAVRSALDSAYVRMTVCFMQQELEARVGIELGKEAGMESFLDEVQTLLGKVR
jgi:CsoR family transcriptional regulator, copper-sensing transcriptional repressor